MFLQELLIQNFRNYKEISFRFDSKLIFIIGDNGSGKTNIIEAINHFSTFKSFRDNSDEELVNWQTDFFYLKSKLIKEAEEYSFEIGFSKSINKKRKIKVNNNVIQKKQDILGEFKVVVFSPSDLKIIEGGSINRRKFIDTTISLIDRSYYISILEYNKILKQRNSLLKKKDIHLIELDPWDQLLYSRAKEIYEKRKIYIEKLNHFFETDIRKISEQRDLFEIKYKPNISNYDLFLVALKERFKRDRILGYTSVGIHRDELFIGNEGKDIMEFASQGQKRSTVISLKTSMFYLIKELTNESPILLIDDVIRELDIKRREQFVDLLKVSEQTFFTTTDLEGLKEYLDSIDIKIQVIKIKEGRIDNSI
jgi:DNA replication and repair protein RecF